MSRKKEKTTVGSVLSETELTDESTEQYSLSKHSKAWLLAMKQTLMGGSLIGLVVAAMLFFFGATSRGILVFYSGCEINIFCKRS